MRKGVLFAVLGLLLGALLASGLLYIKSYGGRALIGLLASEVERSGPYKLAYDTVEVSLLTLSAEAHNVRVLEGNTTRLFFSKVSASFSLSKITQRQFLLKELQLRDGFADGAGPGSAAFRIVDWLAAPLPPERDTPNRWKLKLQQLTVFNTTVIDRIGDQVLRGTGASLNLIRTPSNDFTLHAGIRRVVLDDGKETQTLLGAVLGELYIADDAVRFDSIEVMRGNSQFNFKGVTLQKENLPLSGEAQIVAQSGDLGLSPPLRGALEVHATVSGTLTAPIVEGTIAASEKDPLSVAAASDFVIAVQTLLANFRASFDGGPHAEVYALNMRDNTFQTSLTTPIRVRSDSLSGAIAVHAEAFTYEDVFAKNLHLDVTLAGSLKKPLLAAKARADEVRVAQVSVGATNASLSFDGDKLPFEISSSATATSPLALSGSGTLHLSPVGAALDTGKFVVDYSPVLNQSMLSLSGSAKGPLTKAGLEASAEVQVKVPHSTLQLNGVANLKNGSLDLELANKLGALSLKGTSVISEHNARIELAAKELTPEMFFPEQDRGRTQCGKAALLATYQFDFSSPLTGDGKIDLQQLSLGCVPYEVTLKKPAELSIARGSLQVANVALGNKISSVEISGEVSPLKGMNILSRGSLDLETLTPIVPTVDDLRGRITLALTATGAISDPAVEGSITVDDAGVEIASKELSFRDIRGAIAIKGGTFTIDGLAAGVNDGSLRLSGFLDVLHLEHSRLAAELTDLTLEPVRDASVTISANLLLAPDKNGSPLLSGTVDITNGELTQSVNLAGMLKSVTQSVFSRPIPVLAQRATSTELPPIPLAIKVRAPNNLTIATPWLSSELKANFDIGGTLADPSPSGSAEFLTGWIGVRDRNFEITSGKIAMVPGTLDPSVDIVGETTARTREGDTVLVLLQVSGKLSEPKLSLSSDRGLSETELLRLITGSGEVSSRTSATSISRGYEIDTLEFIDDRSFLGLGRLVRNLARIDSISVEPTFNAQTGAVEPRLVATKKLFERLALVGETSIGSAASGSQLRLVYDLTRSVDLAAILDAQTRERRTSFGVDATYRVFGTQKRFLEATTSGNRAFRDDEILNALRITENSRIRPDMEGDLASKLLEFYRDHAFADAVLTVKCGRVDSAGFCRTVSVAIEEGEEWTVGEVRFDGEDSHGVLDLERIRSLVRKRAATRELRTQLNSRILARLRADGYLGARIDSRFEPSREQSHTQTLVVRIVLGDPVTFIFPANTRFKAEELLATIDLFGRKQPFGRNTINILLQNIERLYNRAGYPLATIDADRSQDPVSHRVTFLIRIDEGTQLPVKNVILEGSSTLSKDRMEQLVRSEGEELYRSIFTPSYAVAEDVQENSTRLRGIYASQGFPFATVEGRINPLEDGTGASISYAITEGARLAAHRLRVVGLPPDFVEPSPPEAPFSIPVVNSFVQSLINRLQEEGYFHWQVEVERSADGAGLLVRTFPGQRSVVGSIQVEGNSLISAEVILERVSLKLGEPWLPARIEESKKRLFKTGLFSKVDLRSEEDSLPEGPAKLLVLVTERTLQTLKLGAGANSELGLHLFGEATDRSIFGDGRSLTVRLDTYYDRVAAKVSQGVGSISYSDPALFDGPFGYVSDLRFQRLKLYTHEFDLDRTAFANYLHRSWDSGVSASFGHTYMWENLENVSPDVQLSDLDVGHHQLSFITGSATLDGRDDPLLPRNGYTVAFDYQMASEAIGSESNFIGIMQRASFIQPLDFIDKRFSIAIGERVGSEWVYGGTGYVPISQRYYLGGRTSVRGFRENSLGPRGELGGVLGGDLLIAQNAELRYLVVGSTELHVFLDSGTVYLKKQSVRLDDLRESTGIGARYLSPIGPIGLDIGFPLDRRSGEPQYQVHFNIGTNF